METSKVLNQPFSGKELFGMHEFQMGRLHFSGEEDREVIITEAWEAAGKTKKQAWNNMAKEINRRMQGET